jgi:glycerol-3-phosphate dehydrogenase
MKREDHLARLRRGDAFDLLVIGGGATGLGVAVDAAARGYAVALVERADFASGTSSRSTKLVHGGVRYLKQGHLPFVREALRERGRLAQNAPHLVHDREFIVPLFSGLEVVTYLTGLKLYDALAGRLSFGASRLLSREETLSRLPTLEPLRLRRGMLYHDGQFDDARLAVTLARTADRLGAVLVNHCEAEGLDPGAGAAGGVRVRDLDTGERFGVAARCIVNATGVFVEEMRRTEDPAAAPRVTVSQGIHLVLPARFLPGTAALMVPKTEDGRVLFALPWHDRVIVGTTDTPRPRAEAEPRALEAECAFVLAHACRYLTGRPGPADVLSVFAGLRPLIGRAGRSTARLTREHTLDVGTRGMITVTGGKWTTYRRMAEDVVDLAARRAGLPWRASPTAELPLVGAEPGDPAPAGHPHLAVYGSEWRAVLEAGAMNRIHDRLPYLECEVRWAVRREMARTVEDVLARRTRALILDAAAAAESAPRVAWIVAEERSLGAAWAAAEAERFARLARGYLFLDPESRAGREI